MAVTGMTEDDERTHARWRQARVPICEREGCSNPTYSVVEAPRTGHVPMSLCREHHHHAMQQGGGMRVDVYTSYRNDGLRPAR